MRHDAASRPPLSALASAYAWGAGTVFVASLGYFLYFYFVRLGRASAAGGPPGRPWRPTRRS